MAVWYALDPQGRRLAECEAPDLRLATIEFLAMGVPDVARVQSRVAWELDQEEASAHRRNRRHRFPELEDEEDAA